MFARLYQNAVIQKPKTILTLLIFCLLFFGYYTKNFKLDASSDTLILQNDESFKYFNYYNKIFPSKNFLVLAIKTQYKKINKDSNEFEKYEAKARLNLTNKIYRTFDENLNQKYKVELNKKTIDRVKSSF